MTGIGLPVFAAANPVRPMAGLATGVQEKDAPETPEVSVTAVVAVPAQIAWVSCDGITLATGWTFTLYADTGPGQPLAVGVTEYCTVPNVVPPLARLSVILPVPLAVFPVTLPAVTVDDHA